MVAAASEAGGVCTNGMSEHARNAENSNSALLVSVTPADFPSAHPLAGLELQSALEQAAFVQGGGDFSAPAIRMQDFMEECEPRGFGAVHPSYPRGVRAVSPEALIWAGSNALIALILFIESKVPFSILSATIILIVV